MFGGKNIMPSGTELNREKLIEFLEFVAEKGLMNPQTAIGYKKASGVILQILDAKEAADLSKIDLNAVFLRYRNLATSKVKPATLKTYQIRTRAAINMFIEYTKDPSSWKPGIKTRVLKVQKSQSQEQITTEEQITRPEEVIEEEKIKYPTLHIDLQIHISPDAKPEQIDKIFSSMREHLYPN